MYLMYQKSVKSNLLTNHSLVCSTVKKTVILTGASLLPLFASLLLMFVGSTHLRGAETNSGYGEGSKNIVISEISYLGNPHFRVETPSATYYISKQSGGASSIIDKDGNDWVNFSRTGNNPPYNSADSDFRGMPNLVFQGEDDGVGHPVGLNVATTKKTADNQLYVTSISGLWEFSWTFHIDHALITVEKTDASRKYWFLYEGPIGGKFSPATHYWGNDIDGIRTDQPVINRSVANGNWQWAFFGDEHVSRCFYVAMAEKDTCNDFFAYMGNRNNLRLESEDGMGVFGFGRSGAEPQMTGSNTFVFGFYETKLQEQANVIEFSTYINRLISQLTDMDPTKD